MVSSLWIVLLIALGLVPPEVASFSIAAPDGVVVVATRQADGNWRAVGDPNVEHAAVAVDGTAVTTIAGGETRTNDIGSFLGMEPGVAWADVPSVGWGRTTITIERTATGLVLVESKRRQPPEEHRRYVVTWGAAEAAE